MYSFLKPSTQFTNLGSEKSVGIWSDGQEEARMTKEDVEDGSGEGEQECGLGEKRRHESSEMESGS